MKLIFCLQKNKSYLQGDSITLGVCSQVCLKEPIQQICYLQYLKEVNDEVDFLHAYKHKSLLQIDTMVLM